jgi:hypothetical protein
MYFGTMVAKKTLSVTETLGSLGGFGGRCAANSARALTYPRLFTQKRMAKQNG